MRKETTLINDDRCKRVMKKFRKRRRQKGSSMPSLSRFGAAAERFEMLETLRVKKGTTASSLTADDENLESTSFIFQKAKHNFGRSFVHQYQNHKDSNHKRRIRVAWGEEIARRRAFSGGRGGEDQSNKPILKSSQPKLVYRKPDSMSETSLYSRCAFLDSYDKVLAVDNRGTLDLVRLADIRSQNKLGTQRGNQASQSQHKIVANFELGAELKQRSFSTVHVQALSGGSTVAFGLEDDSLCLLDLEGRMNQTLYDGSNSDDLMMPLSLRSGPITSSRSPMFTASRTNHPRRTHYRDRRNPRLSLHELCRHRTNQNNGNCVEGFFNYDHNDVSDLHLIDYTRKRISSPVNFIPDLRPPHDARWDILEIHPNAHGSASLLYVAHVDSDYDAFWTQVLDGRVRASKAGKQSRKKHNATTILIDATTRDRPGTVEEHVTACAMATDVCMATAHISCGNYGSTPASEFFDRGLPYAGYSGMSSCVKLWDLRMVHKKKTGLDKSPLPADTIIFSSPPSFENADFALVEPSVTIPTRLTSKDGSLAFSKATFEEDCFTNSRAEMGSSLACGDYVITNLSSSRDSYVGPSNNGSARGGSMIVTTQSRTKSTRVEHAKLDLSGPMQMTRKVAQTNCSMGCHPVYAIASSHNYLATCSNIQNNNSSSGNGIGGFRSRSSEASTKISLYDLTDMPLTDRYSCASSQQREDPSWSYQTETSLTDRYGVNTELSCIAMNSNGTSLLGGTTDGDLFVWRGV